MKALITEDKSLVQHSRGRRVENMSGNDFQAIFVGKNLMVMGGKFRSV
jgi:hypothetical protein